MNIDNIRGLVVINPKYAKELLRLGYHIVDIKPDRTDKRRSVFIFKDEGAIHEDLQDIISKESKEKEQISYERQDGDKLQN